MTGVNFIRDQIQLDPGENAWLQVFRKLEPESIKELDELLKNLELDWIDTEPGYLDYTWLCDGYRIIDFDNKTYSVEDVIRKWERDPCEWLQFREFYQQKYIR